MKPIQLFAGVIAILTAISLTPSTTIYAANSQNTTTPALKNYETTEKTASSSIELQDRLNTLAGIWIQAQNIKKQLESLSTAKPTPSASTTNEERAIAKIVEKMSKDDIRNYVLGEAEKVGVHVAKIDHIVTNESHYDPEAIGDMDIKCERTGRPIRARGIWQFTECYYPEISDECAFDIRCSTEIALNIIANSKKACISQWTTCRNWYRI